MALRSQKARAVTRGAVRCSAWLGVSGRIGLVVESGVRALPLPCGNEVLECRASTNTSAKLVCLDELREYVVVVCNRVEVVLTKLVEGIRAQCRPSNGNARNRVVERVGEEATESRKASGWALVAKTPNRARGIVIQTGGVVVVDEREPGDMSVSLGLALEVDKALFRGNREYRTFRLGHNVRKRLTTPSSATAERGAVAAGWSEERGNERRTEPRSDETGPS